MKQLSREAFEHTRAFLMAQGSPLERALSARHFEGAGADKEITHPAAKELWGTC